MPNLWVWCQNRQIRCHLNIMCIHAKSVTSKPTHWHHQNITPVLTSWMPASFRPWQTVSIASKQNMLFTVPLHVSSGYPQPFISHSVYDVVFRFAFLASVSATRNKTRKHEMQRVFSKGFFFFFFFLAYRLTSTLRTKTVTWVIW
jgi:hypothetical protein